MIDLANMTVPVQKGESPLSQSQFASRIENRKRRVLPRVQESLLLATDPDLSAQVGAAMQSLLVKAEANNQFNHQIAAYQGATVRLARYALAAGRGAVLEDQPTGEIDDGGNPVVESVEVSPEIPPLPAEVEKITYDASGDPTAVMVPNPAIAKDDAERAAAQAVIDGTPQDVKDWVDAG